MHGLPHRLEGLLRSGNARDRWLLVLLIAALPCINLLAFTWGAANTAIIEDQWYFMPMIRDYFAGQFHLFSLWVTHSQHRTPGYKLLFLANAIFFKLDMRLEAMLGLVALTGSVLLLMKRFQDTLPPSTPYMTALLGLTAIGITGFNLNQWGNLVYSLTALAGYTGILCFVWVWLMLDTQLRSDAGPGKTAGLCLALLFTLVSFAAGMGPALIVSLLLVPVAIMLIERRASKGTLTLLGWLALCSLVFETIYWFTGGIKLSSPHTLPFMTVFLQDPVSVLEYLVLAFAGSVMPAEAMEKHLHGPGRMLDLLAGVNVICLYAVCGYTYLRLHMWKASYLPAFLMMFSALFIVSTLVVRLPSAGLNTSETPRYVLYSQLGFVGCLWVLFHRACSRNDAGRSPWQSLLNSNTFFMGAALLYTFGLVALWTYHPLAVRNNANALQEVLAGGFQKADWVCLDPKLCNEGRATLIQYRLNVFADQQPTEDPSHDR